jgi:hypothetical protein
VKRTDLETERFGVGRDWVAEKSAEREGLLGCAMLEEVTEPFEAKEEVRSVSWVRRRRSWSATELGEYQRELNSLGSRLSITGCSGMSSNVLIR